MTAHALNYTETCLIYPVTGLSKGGREVLGTASEVPCLAVYAKGYLHSDRQDAITSDTRLFLPATDPFVRAAKYRLEGMVVVLNPFGSDTADQFFKIATVTPARDTLLGNQVQHVECTLNKVTEFTYVS